MGKHRFIPLQNERTKTVVKQLFALNQEVINLKRKNKFSAGWLIPSGTFFVDFCGSLLDINGEVRVHRQKRKYYLKIFTKAGLFVGLKRDM